MRYPKPLHPSVSSDPDEDALGWVVRLTSGHSTPDDHNAFRTWRDGSPVNLAALRRARVLWTKIGLQLLVADNVSSDGFCPKPHRAGDRHSRALALRKPERTGTINWAAVLTHLLRRSPHEAAEGKKAAAPISEPTGAAVNGVNGAGTEGPRPSRSADLAIAVERARQQLVAGNGVRNCAAGYIAQAHFAHQPEALASHLPPHLAQLLDRQAWDWPAGDLGEQGMAAPPFGSSAANQPSMAAYGVAG